MNIKNIVMMCASLCVSGCYARGMLHNDDICIPSKTGCMPRARFEPIEIGYPYGQEWTYGRAYLEVPTPYRDEQGSMFRFGWYR